MSSPQPPPPPPPPLQPQPLTASGSPFSGFSSLCKGIAVILVASYAVQHISPSTVYYLALIPARTIPFAWTLVTAGYFEQSIFSLIVSVIGLLFIGKLLEPIWGSKEFFKFIFAVNFLTTFCVFIVAISLYYTTRLEIFLYRPLSGFHGVLSGFIVGIKQIIPDQELSIFFSLKVKAKWAPSLLVLVTTFLCFFVLDSASYLPTIVSGTYMSWLYLRYLQRNPQTNLKGDPSDEFAFVTFFPEFFRPFLDPVASVCYHLFCGKSRTSGEGKDQVLGGMPLPGSDPVEASRRRERGARALEERLASEKTNPGVTADENAGVVGPANV